MMNPGYQRVNHAKKDYQDGKVITHIGWANAFEQTKTRENLAHEQEAANAHISHRSRRIQIRQPTSKPSTMTELSSEQTTKKE